MNFDKQYTTVDKSGWNRGEWDEEPDKAQWIDEASGLDCLVVRNPHGGHWCGYVGITDEHPLFEIGYGEYEDLPDLDAHGGLTYSDFCMDIEDECEGVCHVPNPGRSEHVWWFGFDCAHGGDLSPTASDALAKYGTYKDLDFVVSQCSGLAAQLKAAQ